MTVNTKPSLRLFTTVLDQTIFVYDFTIIQDDDLDVYGTLPGEVFNKTGDLFILGVDYTVQGAGNPNGGTLTLITALPAGSQLTVDGDLIIGRGTDFGPAFTAQQINEGLDRVTMFARDNQTHYQKRGLQYAVGDNIVVPEENNLPQLKSQEFWQKADSGPGFVGAKLEPNADVNTLRSELAAENAGADGSRIVGFESATFGSGTTHDAIIDLQSQITALTNTIASLDPPGSMRISTISVPFGITWLALNTTGDISADNTIGNAASSASLRANADTLNLFTVYWDQLTDENAPVSGGRGASALDDFNADKTLQLGVMAGRALVARGAVTTTVRTIGEFFGIEGHAMTLAQLIAHVHGLATDTAVISTAIEADAGSFSFLPDNIPNPETISTPGAVGEAFPLDQPSTTVFIYLKL